MSFLDGFQGGIAPMQHLQQEFSRLKQERQRRDVNNLHGLYLSGQAQDPRMVAAEIARNGGDPSFVLKDQQQRQEQSVKRAGQVAAFIASAPDEQSRRNAYRSALPTLRPISEELGLPLPEDWSEDFLDEVQGIARMFGGESPSSGSVQSSFVDAQGNRVAIMRDGSVRVLGQNAPNNQIVEGAGGFYGINKGNLQAAPVMMGGFQTPQSPEVSADLNSLSPQEQARASQMIQAGQDFHIANGRVMPGQSGQQLQPAAKPQAPSELQQRLALADQFGASEDDKRQMVLGASATRGTLSQKERRAIALQQAQIPALERRVNNIAGAFEKLSGNFFDGGPMDQFAVGMTKDGQMLEATAAQLKPLLLSFVRVPGIGAQSDLEARLDALQYPSIGNHPEVNRALLAELKRFIGDLKNAYANADSDASQAAPQQAAPSNIDALLDKYK